MNFRTSASEKRFERSRAGWWMLAALAALPGNAKPGDHRFYHSTYIEYIEGDLPVILSASHGGALLPPEISGRVSDSAKALSDQNTEELAMELVAQVFKASGHYPHAVINHIHRMKLDPNRDSADSQERPYADDSGKAAWMAYHDFIDTAEAKVEALFGKGMLFDLHGHQHALARVELGYLITNFQLRQADQDLGKLVANSSLARLSLESVVPFPDLVRGTSSFGGYLQGKGIPAVPSPQFPHNDTNPYFSGGYTIRSHCLTGRGAISGMQIELPLIGYRNSPASRAAFNALLWAVMSEYMHVHLQLVLPALPAGLRLSGISLPTTVGDSGSGGFSGVNGRKSSAKPGFPVFRRTPGPRN